MAPRFRPWWTLCLTLAALLLTIIPVAAQSPLGVDLSVPPTLERLQRSYEVETAPDATAFSLWTGGTNLRHEVWFRVIGGDALWQQRLQVYKEQALPRPINELPPPSEQVSQIIGNQVSDWVYLGFESEFFTYYFDGDHWSTQTGAWEEAYGVRVHKRIYENGDLYEILFEDQYRLDDYNDLEIEVVLARGQRFPH
ncbi:MAG: hypothetical protein ACFB0C_21905 [Leptolyngbyaceae cyanobacterium]